MTQSSTCTIWSAGIWPLMKSDIGVSTKPGHSAVTRTPSSTTPPSSESATADHRVLGGRVDGEPRLGLEARDRGEVHDPPARPSQQGQRLAGDEEQAADVDAERDVEPLRRVAVDRAAEADAGRVHEQVERSDAVAVRGHRGRRLRLVQEVRRHHVRPVEPPRAGSRATAVTSQPGRQQVGRDRAPDPDDAPVTSAPSRADRMPRGLQLQRPLDGLQRQRRPGRAVPRHVGRAAPLELGVARRVDEGVDVGVARERRADLGAAARPAG